MKPKILLVDDDVRVLEGLTRRLREHFDIATASSASAGLEKINAEGGFSVVVSDHQMPGGNGIDFLREVHKCAPQIVRMMLTGDTDIKTAMNAINEGSIYRIFPKPCTMEMLVQGIGAGIEYQRLMNAERDLLERTLAGSIKMLIDMLAMIDGDSFGRSSRLRNWAKKMAQMAEYENIWQIDMAALLSKVGFVAVPPDLREKARRGDVLTPSERAIFVRLPEVAKELLRNIPRLEPVAEMIYYQNKGYDGSGFPEDNIKGEKIPNGARILKILNDILELTDGQAPTIEALGKLEGLRGLYDPELFDILRACIVSGFDSNAKIFELSSVRRLLAGDVLQRDLEYEDGSLVLAAGLEISESQLARLRNLALMNQFRMPIMVMRR